MKKLMNKNDIYAMLMYANSITQWQANRADIKTIK